MTNVINLMPTGGFMTHTNDFFEDGFKLLHSGDLKRFNAFMEGALAVQRRPTYANLQKLDEAQNDKN